MKRILIFAGSALVVVWLLFPADIVSPDWHVVMTRNWWVAPALVIAALAAMRIFYLIRARAMRGFASRLGFQYIGPGAPPSWWWNPPHLKTRPPVPAWVSVLQPRIRQVWNMIEGERNGVSVLIFDSIIGGGGGGAPCTHIAVQKEENPFETDKVEQSDGWTVLRGVRFLGFYWTMGTKQLAEHLDELGNE